MYVWHANDEENSTMENEVVRERLNSEWLHMELTRCSVQVMLAHTRSSLPLSLLLLQTYKHTHYPQWIAILM